MLFTLVNSNKFANINPCKILKMLTIYPQYVTDTEGKKFVVLPVEVFQTIVEELGEFLDIKMLKNINEAQEIAFKPVN